MPIDVIEGVVSLTKDAFALPSMREAFEGIPSPPFMDLDESTFLRYLRARQYDVSRATTLLQESIKWRKDFGLADLQKGKWQETLAKENSTGKMYCRGFDREVSPVFITP